jgi:hypothetical protein
LLARAGASDPNYDKHEGDGQCASNRDPVITLHGGGLFHAASFGREWTVRYGPVHHRGDANHFGGAAGAAPGQPSYVRTHGHSAADHYNTNACDWSLRKHREH